MRQRILGSHTPPCHRRMVITTQFNVCLVALQSTTVQYHSRWFLIVLWLPVPSKKKCFSNALRRTLVVLEMH